MAKRYLLEDATSAAVLEAGVRRLIQIPSSSVIDVATPLDGVRGLVEVMFNGKAALMFAEDIRERGKPIPKISLR